MRVGSAAAAGLLDADEVVDERSGLTVADFQESVDILMVHSTADVGEVPYLLIGNLNEDSDEQEKDEINA